LAELSLLEMNSLFSPSNFFLSRAISVGSAQFEAGEIRVVQEDVISVVDLVHDEIGDDVVVFT
jgi:hypothetical protein